MPRARLLAATCALAAALGAPARADETDDDRSPLSFGIGNAATVTFFGYVKADFIRNLGFDLGNTTFAIRDMGLATGPAAGDFDSGTLRETRIGFDVRGGDVFARFEGDFYGSPGYLRLRHAYVEWNGLMIGQNWSNFMSVENLAPTVDFQGAGGVPFARVPQVRYTFEPVADLTLSASVEEAVGNDDDLAYTLAARYGFDAGMVRLSGYWRDAVIGGNRIDGWAANLGTVLSLWPGGRIQADIATGEGTGDILGAGLTGASLFKAGRPVGFTAGAVSVSQQATDKLRLAATTSWVDVDRATGTDLRGLRSLHLSAFYAIRPDTTLMAEYFTAEREDGAGARFDVDRVQLAVRFSF